MDATKKKVSNVSKFRYRFQLTLSYGEDIDLKETYYLRKQAYAEAIALAHQTWGRHVWNVTSRTKELFQLSPVKDKGVIRVVKELNPKYKAPAKAKVVKPKLDPDRDPTGDRRRIPSAVMVDQWRNELTTWFRPSTPKGRQDLNLEDRAFGVISMKARGFTGKRYRFTVIVDESGRAWVPILWLPDQELAVLLRMEKAEVIRALDWRAMLESKKEAKS